jgi:hypothetical protein|tara:strand:- start:76 stop:291 length:216 start_codon:yes stop_codon:yes gene_type:complete
MEAFEVLKSVSLQVQELNIVVNALEFLTTKNFVIVQVDTQKSRLGEVSEFSNFIIAEVDRSKVSKASGVSG